MQRASAQAKIFAFRLVLFATRTVFIYSYTNTLMKPDYPTKVFYDKRKVYALLMQSLATDAF
jgi:hypothetical protein